MLLPRLRFFLTQALYGLWRSAWVTTLSIVTIGIALAILAIFSVAVRNLSRVADELGREVEISAYLARDLSEAEGLQRAKQIETWSDIEHVRYVTSTAAMQMFQESLGRDAVILEGLPTDVLPPSIEARLVERSWTADAVAGLAQRLLRIEGVEDVRYGQEDIERLHALLSFARITAMIVGITLCLAVLLLVSNTIRLAVYARRDEIEIMSLIGATDGFVRTPFVIEGAVQGFLGGALACAALASAKEALIQGISLGLSYAYGHIELEFVPSAFFAYALLLGTALGLLGSLVAVGRFVRV